MNKSIKKFTNKQPLADRLRPRILGDFFGQEKIIGRNTFLKRAIMNDSVPSMILWGPPGSGKTTLAHIIAHKTKADFVQLSAVASGKKDLMEVVSKAKTRSQQENKKTILFIDEIHRWNKAQQDALLPSVERGVITLIGATTENPSFEVNSALVSRARVFVLKKLSNIEIAGILRKTLIKLEKTGEKVQIKKEATAAIADLSNGDARMALNTLEACIESSRKTKKEITKTDVKEVLQKTHILYDKNGEEHYNIISALHKSLRGGDAHASVYWLARMLEGGEDPVYIARRLVRFAAEDVGLADNHALILSNAVFDACKKIGYPECNVHLSQCVIYLAKTKKSILAYDAYKEAKKDVERHGNLDVPLQIRNAPTGLMKKLGYGKDYKYTPKEDSSEQQYLPDKLKNKRYF
ncbi:replication-associated recombination protein A [bacterium]|jgi:putative ATPase|nr:replication-associated recombination protein A [bacterium]MBT6755745.1 replication-associated recombination protein A [Candidatus Paceibacterota bacterium]MBT7038180.1 replication-associated recombination protein A [bacterium]MBT7431621.1 replication-associated recombination protein A [bacterium]